MPTRARDLTHEHLLSRLRYEPDTGIFTWLWCDGLWKGLNTRQAGKTAGYPDGHGYIVIGLNGHLYAAHRLAWFYMTKAWPESDIDHRDLNKGNNKWDNLRLATHGQNMHNCLLRKHSQTGYRGVQFTKGAYQAVIRHKKKRIYLGRFATAEEAHSAYCEAGRSLYGEFFNPGSRAAPVNTDE